MNRWPFRQGTALGAGIMVLVSIGAVAFLNATRSDTLPQGFAGEGMYVVEYACADCHGYAGEGTTHAPALVGWEAAPMATLTRPQFAGLMAHGSGAMQAPALSDQEVADVYAYLRQVQASGES